MPTDTPAAALRFAHLPWLGITLAVVGAAAFATKGIVIKLALAEGVDALTTLTWRMIVAVPIFVAVGMIGYRAPAAPSTAGSAAGADRKDAAADAGRRRARLLRVELSRLCRARIHLGPVRPADPAHLSVLRRAVRRGVLQAGGSPAR